ncbi:tautomerase family protein [Cupriavidus sp. 2SB]|uniref:tautomerase family protein n=1 Tax=Cupriavidus sp. 2SB TaxID=2502199 RepID=UPI0010F8B168|nr:tautomerase family protein [Cupriavidus sp. 2SB]
MPLLNFHVFEGRDGKALRTLLDAAHQAMVEAFDVPVSDRYQTVTQHRTEELILDDTGLGMTRTQNALLLAVVTRPRPQAQKVRFYELLSRYLHEQCGISPDDLVVSLVENADADWSFGRGRAQFLTGEL